MKLRGEMLLGGHWNMSLVRARTGATTGFTGCIGRLKINNKVYDMRQGFFVGDALRGLDVGKRGVQSVEEPGVFDS